LGGRRDREPERRDESQQDDASAVCHDHLLITCIVALRRGDDYALPAAGPVIV
jgi:hypothetical protein